MFGLFKRKTKREKLENLYRKKKELAFKASKTNRQESDRFEKEANDILIKLEWKFINIKIITINTSICTTCENKLRV